MSRIVVQFRCTSWQMLKAVMRRQFSLAIVRKHEFIQVIAFFFLAVTLFRVSISARGLEAELSGAIIYCSWLFALMFTSGVALETDFTRGYLQQFYLTGVSLEIPMLAHYITNMSFYCGMWLLISPLAMLVMQINDVFYLSFITTGVLFTASITCTLLACRAMLLGSAPSMILAVLAIPLLLPIIIFAVLALQQWTYMLVLLLLWLGLLPISIMAASFAAAAAFVDAP